MPTNDKEVGGAKNNKQRTEIKDLPREEKELSEDEQKKVRGGLGGGGEGGFPAFNKATTPKA